MSSTGSETHPTTDPTADVELDIGGMTCASCANRIERKLNKLDGVRASVNYATEKARVQVPVGLDPALLVAQAPVEPGSAPLRSLRVRLAGSALLTVPVVALAMVPAWQFTYWQWISL